MKYMGFFLFLIASPAFATLCGAGAGSGNLLEKAKTIIVGEVKEKNGQLYIKVYKSWFPIAKSVTIRQVSKDHLALFGYEQFYKEIKKGQWIFLITTMSSAGAIDIPAGCGSQVIILDPKSKNFKTDLKEKNQYIENYVSKKFGKAKFFPNKK